MDKRKEKTFNKVFLAFKELINVKNYNDITIQDILDKSKIARSTFYANFKTKDDMLVHVCETIFNHVFSKSLTEEKSHDFSNSSIYDYKHLITHIFYHFNDERMIIHAILRSQSKDFFINKLKKEMTSFAVTCIDNNIFRKPNLPKDLQVKFLLNNFILLLEYYDEIKYNQSPEALCEYFLILNS